MSWESDAATILDDVNLDLPAREVSVLIGPSGSGKTSLLRLLNRLDDPTSGTVQYKGNSVADVPVRELRARVGFVFQTPVMFEGTVRENLAVAADIAGMPSLDMETKMQEVLQFSEFDLQLLDRDAARLSVGQKQRVSLARTLMTGPETLLLDEPTASLDPETADKLMQTIGRLSDENGLTVVAATHRLAEARRISGHVVMLDKGRVVDTGPTGDIFDRSTHPRIRSFLENMS